MSNRVETVNVSGLASGFENDVSLPVIVLMRIVTTLIPIVNGYVCVCLVANRRRFRTTFWLQLTCLAVNDVFTGIIFMFPIWMDYTEIGARGSALGCLAGLLAMFIFNLSTLINITGVCVHRISILRRVSQQLGEKRTTKYSIYILLSSWAFSTLYFSVPGFVWLEEDNYVLSAEGCKAENLFGDNLKNFTVLTFVGFISVLLPTNFMFIQSVWVLKKTLSRSIHPAPASNTGTVSNSGDTVPVAEPPQRNARPAVFTNILLRRIRVSIITIGVILFLHDLFTLPILILSGGIAFGQFPNATIGRKEAIGFIFALNSLFNPFVYTLMIKEIRNIMRKPFKDLWNAIVSRI